tara:strand:+ start:3383 stop:4255 length:873 start_codon:yes stop_codon:yes gene_type:complete
LAFNVKKHDKILANTLEDIQSGVFDNVKALENEVADIVALGLAPEQVRPQIMQAFGRSSESVKTQAAPLTNLSQDFLNQSSVPADNADLQSESTLLNLSEQTLSSTMNSSGEDVVQTVVLATVAGLATQIIVDQVRGRIAGINMDSNNPDVRREQRKLRKMMKTGGYTGAQYASQQSKIKGLLPGNVNTAASLAVKMNTASDSVVGSFNGTFAKSRATRQEVEMFEYVGGIMATSRPFCISMVGSRMSADEINEVWDGSSWAGKEPGDPFVVRGGYNCNHYWVPIESEDD